MSDFLSHDLQLPIDLNFGMCLGSIVDNLPAKFHNDSNAITFNLEFSELHKI